MKVVKIRADRISLIWATTGEERSSLAEEDHSKSKDEEGGPTTYEKPKELVSHATAPFLKASTCGR
jgi:hypothetical protein